MAAGRCDHFWKKHIETFTNGKETYSDEWYDFINRMLQYLPQDRMTIAEIKEHPWYTKPIPSESEVLKEFESRYNRIHSATGSGDLPSEVDQSIYTDSKHAHRGEDDGEDAKMPTLERTCKEYEPVTKITQFFSTFDPKKLYDALALFSESMQALDF
jgi:serine/threonine protein kinase